MTSTHSTTPRWPSTTSETGVSAHRHRHLMADQHLTLHISDEWPALTADNVEGAQDSESPSYYLWRNVFASVNLLRSKLSIVGVQLRQPN